MSSRRSLLSRQQRDARPPQIQRSRQNRDEGSRAEQSRQPAALPPYEPPSFPLTESGKRSLAGITITHDYRKLEEHLNTAVSNITKLAGESIDRLYQNKDRVRKLAQTREDAQDDSEKTEAEEAAEQRAREMEVKVEKLTAESEKALRDLIDYKQELAQQGELLQKVRDKAAAATGGNNTARRPRRRPSDDLEDEDEDVEPPAENEDIEMSVAEAILSPTELLRQAKEEYRTTYTSKTMRVRYAENNDYIGFKRTIHDAHNPGGNPPPVPPASSWFPNEDGGVNSNPSAARRRRLASQTDNTENGGDDDDDDIQMTGVVSSLKCPLTLQTFKEPYSNKKCKHTFEKSAILQFHRENAVSFVDPSQGGRRGRGVPAGPRQLKCPQHGCDAMLEIQDFYFDQLVLRQVRRQEAQAAADLEDDGIDIVPATQRNRPQDIPEEEQRRAVKQERMSRGPSRAHVASTPVSEEDDPEPIDMDES